MIWCYQYIIIITLCVINVGGMKRTEVEKLVMKRKERKDERRKERKKENNNISKGYVFRVYLKMHLFIITQSEDINYGLKLVWMWHQGKTWEIQEKYEGLSKGKQTTMKKKKSISVY